MNVESVGGEERIKRYLYSALSEEEELDGITERCR